MLRISRATFYKKLAKFGWRPDRRRLSFETICVGVSDSRQHDADLVLASSALLPHFQPFQRKDPHLAQGLL